MTTGTRRILVVEDETIVAMLLEDMLIDLGFEVVGPATRMEEALQLARDAQVDLAILDVNLNGRESFPIADVLRARGVPFVFATGYGAQGVDGAYRDAPTLEKPFTMDEVERVLAGLAG